MAKLGELTVDIAQELIHDKIREIAQTLLITCNVKLESVSIDWFNYLGTQPVICEIKIVTSKR